MKKLISALLALALLPCFSPAYASEEEIFMDFSENGGSKNLSINSIDSYTYEVRNGRRGAYISNSTGTKELGFNISDSAIYNPKEKAAEITVEYFDEGAGYFVIRYDGSEDVSLSEPVLIQNSKEWKTHTFRLYDAVMKNNNGGGCDFAVDLETDEYEGSRCPLIIGKISVNAAEQRGATVNVTSKRAGNIFVNGEDIDLNLEFKSTVRKKVNYNISYTVRDAMQGDVVWTGSDTLSLGAAKPVVKQVHYTPERYGLFVLEIQTVSDDGVYRSTEESKFSYSMFNGSMPQNESLGTCVHFTARDSGAVAPLIEMTGMGYIRDEFLWKDYEKSKGVYKFLPAWERYFKDVKTSDLDMLLILGLNNPLYRDGSLPETEEELEAWGNYVYSIVSYLGDKVSVYEVWNEPNLAMFSLNTSPEVYAEALKVAYVNVKKANPNAKVMGCATAGINPEYYERVFQAGGADYMDILSFHFYFLDNKVMDDYVSLYERLLAVNEVVEKYKPSLDMVVTEFGWATNVNSTTGQIKSDNFLKTMAIYKKIPRITQSYWYEFQKSGTSLYNYERNFGYVAYWDGKDTYAADPVYCSTSAYNAIIGDRPLADMYEDKEKGIYVYKYDENYRGNETMMMWKESGSGIISIDLGCDTLTLYDDFGNETEIYADGGVFTFMLGDSPVMAEGSFTKFEVSASKINIPMEINPTSGEIVEINPKLAEEFSVEYYPKENIRVEENADNRIRFSLSGTTGYQSSMGVAVKKDGKMICRGEVIIRLVESASAQILYLPYENSVSKAVISSVVSNNRSDKPISGTIKFTEPKIFADKLPTVTFTDIQPNSSNKFYMYLPDFAGSGCFDFKAEIGIDGAEPFTVTCRNDMSFAKRCETPPKQDGVIEPGEYYAEYAFNTVNENIVNLFDDAIRNENDLSGIFYASYDDEYFYLAADITDDTHYQIEPPGTMWRGDGIQFALCDRSAQLKPYKEIALALKGSTVQVNGYSDEKFPMKAAIKRNGSKTVYEIAVPFEGVFGEGWSIEGKESLGFSVLVNDNDGPDSRSFQEGRKGWIEYGSGIGTVKSTDLYVDLKLRD